MSKPKLGSGARFKAVEKSAAASGAKDPAAVVAAVGMKKYGKKKMAKMAAKGKKTHGMQMGPGGFGMTHGYDDDDERDTNNAHEYKGC